MSQLYWEKNEGDKISIWDITDALGNNLNLFSVNYSLQTQSIPLCKQVGSYLKVQRDLTEHVGSSGAQRHLPKSLFVNNRKQ